MLDDVAITHLSFGTEVRCTNSAAPLWHLYGTWLTCWGVSGIRWLPLARCTTWQGAQPGLLDLHLVGRRLAGGGGAGKVPCMSSCDV